MRSWARCFGWAELTHQKENQPPNCGPSSSGRRGTNCESRHVDGAVRNTLKSLFALAMRPEQHVRRKNTNLIKIQYWVIFWLINSISNNIYCLLSIISIILISCWKILLRMTGTDWVWTRFEPRCAYKRGKDLVFLIRALVKLRTMFRANYLKLLLRSFFEPAVVEFGAC